MKYVHLTQAGQIGNALMNLVVSPTVASNELMQSWIKITPVTTNSTTLRLTLQGGKIVFNP